MVGTQAYTYDWWLHDAGDHLLIRQHNNPFSVEKKITNPEFLSLWRNRGVTLREAQ